jgi:hypothetical protein
MYMLQAGENVTNMLAQCDGPLREHEPPIEAALVNAICWPHTT